MVMMKHIYIDGKKIVVLDEQGNEIGNVALPPRPEFEFEKLFLEYARNNLKGAENVTNENIRQAAEKACKDISENDEISSDIQQIARYCMGKF